MGIINNHKYKLYNIRAKMCREKRLNYKIGSYMWVKLFNMEQKYLRKMDNLTERGLV